MIYRVQGDGSKEEVFYSSPGLDYPYGIAIDLTAKIIST